MPPEPSAARDLTAVVASVAMWVGAAGAIVLVLRGRVDSLRGEPPSAAVEGLALLAGGALLIGSGLVAWWLSGRKLAFLAPAAGLAVGLGALVVANIVSQG